MVPDNYLSTPSLQHLFHMWGTVAHGQMTQFVPGEYQHQNANPSLIPVPSPLWLYHCKGYVQISGQALANQGLGRHVPWHVYPKAGGYKHSSCVTYKCLLQSLVRRELYVNVAWMKEGRLCYDPVPCGPIKNQGLSWQLIKPEFFVEMESWGKNSYTGETWDQTSKTLPNQPLKTNLTVEIRVSQKY